MTPVRRGGRQALSLIETLIALFVITFAVLEMAALFHSALEGAKRASKVSLATTIASKRMAEIVYWAGDGNNFSNWTSVDGAQSADGQFPDFLVATDSQPETQYSPCSLTELRFPVGQQRLLSSSLRKVRVRVSWGPGSRDRIDLVSLVGAPPRELGSIGINEPIPDPVAPFGASVALTVYARDTANQPIPDLFPVWYLEAGSGNGEVISARDGRSAQLRDQVYNPSTATYQSAPGTATLSVKASFLGVSKSLNQPLNLGP